MPRPPLPLDSWGKIRRSTINGQPVATAYYRDSSGKRRQMQRNGKTEAQAERLLEAALRQRIAADSESLLTSESTVSELADLWLEERRVKGAPVGTLNTYAHSIRVHITPGVGSLRLREATTPRLDRFIRERMDRVATARTARTVLVQMFTLAVRHGAVTKNPAKDVIAVTPRRKTVTALKIADIHAMRRLFAEHDRTRDSELDVVAQILMATGARIGEVLALTWPDIDLERGRLSITGTLVTDGALVRQDHAKSEAGKRALQLPRTVLDMLTERRVLAHYEIVLPSSVGTYRWPANVRRQWRDALRESPYEGKTPRDFRKAVATLLDRKLGSKAAADQLGHGSDDITVEFYIERQERVADFAEVIETLFESTE